MQTTLEIGTEAEHRAARFLVAHGYTIVARNFRTRFGELDIVARDGDTLVFVEVRRRSSADFGHAAESVNALKRARVSKQALRYLAIARPAFSTARFDIVAITGDEITLIRDAWRL